MEQLTTRELIEYVNNEQHRNTIVAAASQAGDSITTYLDSIYDPEKDGELGADDIRLSAMEVVHDALDISTELNPAAGIYPTKCDDIIGNPAKEFALRELMLNTYRSVAYAPQMRASAKREMRNRRWEEAQRAATFQDVSDTAPSSTLTPFYDAMAHWDEDVEIDIALEELTMRMEETNKTDYRSTILEYDEDAFREERTNPASDPPMASFGTTEWPITVKKRMLAIPFTYEHLREVEFIDKAMEHVEQIAVQRIMAKVDEGLEAMLMGAPVASSKYKTAPDIIKLVDLDATATAGKFTPEAWLNLQKRFKRGYSLTSAIGVDNDITNLQLARVAQTNVMMVALNERDNAVQSGFGGAFQVMNQLAQGVRVGWHDYFEDRIQVGTSATRHNALVVYDVRKAVEYVSQMGTDIIETTRDMLKQTEYIVCSEIWGWISYQPTKAIYVIDLEASDSDTNLKIATD